MIIISVTQNYCYTTTKISVEVLNYCEGRNEYVRILIGNQMKFSLWLMNENTSTYLTLKYYVMHVEVGREWKFKEF